jgi:hypothetical protein
MRCSEDIVDEQNANSRVRQPGLPQGNKKYTRNRKTAPAATIFEDAPAQRRMSVRNEPDTQRIPLSLWAKGLLVPWITKHWALLLSPVFLGVGLTLGYLEACGRPLLWWSSLTMQVLGLALSATALVDTAVEMQIGNPLKAVAKAFAEFPPYRQPKVHTMSAFIKLPAVRVTGSMRVSYPPDATVEERLAFLERQLVNLDSAIVAGHAKQEEKLDELATQLSETRQQMASKHSEIEDRVRMVSVGSFYQVLIGLGLLSLGSIASLFL